MSEGMVGTPATGAEKILPAVDVVVLSLNRTTDTQETIASILDQEGVDLRLWILDQGSSPHRLCILRNLAKNHSAVFLHEAGTNLGVPGGRNVASSLGSAEVIVGVDNDAVFKSRGALRQAAERFDADPTLGAISFRIRVFGTGADDESSWPYTDGLWARREEEFKATTFVGAGHAIRRSAFKRAGEYDDSLFFCWEESDLSDRMLRCGYTILYDPRIEVLHKVSREARVDWSGDRFYYFTRNAVYVHYKRTRAVFSTAMLAAAYLAKGLYNGLPLQAMRGLGAAAQMCFRLGRRPRALSSPLSSPAALERYRWDHDLRYRGSFVYRLKHQVFVKLR